MRPVVHLEVVVPRIHLPLSQVPTAPPDVQSPSGKAGKEGKEEAEQVRVLQFTTPHDVGQSSQIELAAPQSQKKHFRLFQIRGLPETNEPFRLQIWRKGKGKAQSQEQTSPMLSDEIAFSLDFIQQEEPILPTETPINSDIYQVKLYLNAEGMLIGHQIDNSDN